MRWRPTPKAWAYAAAAAILGVATGFVVFRGVQDWRLAEARADAFHAFYRTLVPGQGGLQPINDALDKFPRDERLALLRIAVLSGRKDEADRAREAARALRSATPWGRIALGAALLPEGAIEAEKELAAAAKDLPRRPEPHAYLAAIEALRGEPAKALEHAAAARKAAGGREEGERSPPVAGALLTLLLAEGTAHELAQADDLAVSALEQAALAFPQVPGTRDRLARAIGRRAARPNPDAVAATAAIEAGRRAIANVQPLERSRRVPLYGLSAEQVTVIRGGIGVGEARQGNLEGAKRTLAQAAKDAPREPLHWRNLGAVNAALWHAERTESLKKAHAQNASDALATGASLPGVAPGEALRWLTIAALFATHARENDTAIRLLDQATKHISGTDDGSVDRAYAVAYDSQGRTKQAIDAYRRAISKTLDARVAVGLEERMRFLEERERRK